MKILHLCLSCFFIDDYNYQENILPEIHKQDGNEVMIIASTETYIANKELGDKEAGTYFTKSGIKVVRLNYRKILPKIIMKKIRIYENLITEINAFNPDVIFYHGLGGLAILDIIKYKKKYNNKVKIYVDSHEDFNNSGTNFISKNILHKFINRIAINKALNGIEKIFYISFETKDFLKECFKIPDELMEFFPLGGLILTEEERLKKRLKKREELNLSDEILFIHTGKMNAMKKTKEIILAFSKVQDKRFKLLLIGSISDEIDDIYERINKDKRIEYLGWKNSEELIEYLCAGDVYLQPGTQSATMQNAMCNENALILYPYKSHIPYLKNNGFYVKNEEEIEKVFRKISNDSSQIENMKKNSLKIAKEILDYKKMASVVYK